MVKVTLHRRQRSEEDSGPRINAEDRGSEDETIEPAIAGKDRMAAELSLFDLGSGIWICDRRICGSGIRSGLQPRPQRHPPTARLIRAPTWRRTAARSPPAAPRHRCRCRRTSGCRSGGRTGRCATASSNPARRARTARSSSSKSPRPNRSSSPPMASYTARFISTQNPDSLGTVNHLPAVLVAPPPGERVHLVQVAIWHSPRPVAAARRNSTSARPGRSSARAEVGDPRNFPPLRTEGRAGLRAGPRSVRVRLDPRRGQRDELIEPAVGDDRVVVEQDEVFAPRLPASPG